MALLTHQLEAAINAYLRLDQDTIASIAKLKGKVVLLKIEDWNIRLYLIPTDNGLEIHNKLDTPPDTTIKAKLDALIHLSRQPGSNSALFKNRVEVEGDVETGEKIRNIISEIDIDWEEQLSKLTGDVFAHKVGQFARGLAQFTHKSAATLRESLSEYLHHEVNLLPSRDEVTDFVNQVSTLRNDTDRLEARLNLMTKAGSDAS